MDDSIPLSHVFKPRQAFDAAQIPHPIPAPIAPAQVVYAPTQIKQQATPALHFDPDLASSVNGGTYAQRAAKQAGSQAKVCQRLGSNRRR